MIRISTERETSSTIVTIDGRLETADLEEVQRFCLSIDGKVLLALGRLDVCTEDGIQLLREWLNRGAHLKSANPFLRMVLEEEKGQKWPKKA